MNKKRFYILTTCGMIVLLIVFEATLIFCFGEKLEYSGWAKWLCAGAPVVIVALSFLRDSILRAKFGSKK